MQPQRSIDHTAVPAAPLRRRSGGNVAQGGPVAEWHAQINRSFAGEAAGESRSEALLRWASRLFGIGVLVAGYAIVAAYLF